MYKLVRSIIAISFCLIEVSGFSQNDEIVASTHYPKLLQAKVPFYPPVAASVRFGGTVEIDVVVEDGIIKGTEVKVSQFAGL